MKILYLTLMLFMLIIPLSYAELSINIQIKDSFSEGETTSFQYSIFSDSAQQITFIPHIYCPDSPIAMIGQRVININTGETYSDSYEGVTIDEEIEPQTCTAYVQILNPVEMIKEKNFSIRTLPSFDFDFKICKDSACKEEVKVFLIGEDVFLGFDSEVANPTINVILNYPDESTAQPTMPGSVKATKIGTHELEITVEKQGYKKIKQKQQFAVIEEPPQFESASTCNADGKCEDKETKDNCPQDCKKKETKYDVLVPIIFISIIGLAVTYTLITGKKITKKEKPKKKIKKSKKRKR